MSTIDPLGRWAQYGEKPDYAGLPSFAGRPYTEDPAALEGVDVAGVGAFAVLRVVDYGDAAVVPGDPTRSHAAIEAIVGEVLAAGAMPVILGGDHSIAEPDVRACAAKHGPVGLIHFDAHTDTGKHVF